jgi:hypothetical protein
METKVCKTCGIEKSIDDFFKNNKTKDGHQLCCKECTGLRESEERLRAIRLKKEGYLICKDCGVVDKIENFIVNCQTDVGHRNLCYACLKNRAKIANNTPKRKKYMEEYIPKYRSKNREKGNGQMRNYAKTSKAIETRHKREQGVNHKLIHALRQRLYYLLKVSKTPKDCKALVLLDCTMDFFKKHIESQFSDGMSWNNYGIGNRRWSIDHIIPCASFDMTIEGQREICFRYTNLQPMWHNDNVKKGSLYLGVRHTTHKS